MRRSSWCLLTVALLGIFTGVAGGQKEEKPTIRDIMGKLNRGPNSLTPLLGKDLRDQNPDWELVLESSTEYVQLTRGLLGNTPPKGDKVSWQRLAKAYADNATALDAAARKKDRRSALRALQRINDSCKVCHKVHKKD
jgi:cytochrome c556